MPALLFSEAFKESEPDDFVPQISLHGGGKEFCRASAVCSREGSIEKNGWRSKAEKHSAFCDESTLAADQGRSAIL